MASNLKQLEAFYRQYKKNKLNFHILLRSPTQMVNEYNAHYFQALA